MTMRISIAAQGGHYHAHVVRTHADGTVLDDRLVGSGHCLELDVGADQSVTVAPVFDGVAAGLQLNVAPPPPAPPSPPAASPPQADPAPEPASDPASVLDLDTPLDPPNPPAADAG